MPLLQFLTPGYCFEFLPWLLRMMDCKLYDEVDPFLPGCFWSRCFIPATKALRHDPIGLNALVWRYQVGQRQQSEKRKKTCPLSCGQKGPIQATCCLWAEWQVSLETKGWAKSSVTFFSSFFRVCVTRKTSFWEWGQNKDDSRPNTFAM